MLESLKPYLLCVWNGRDGDDAPPEAQRLVRESGAGRGASNIRCFILDSSGKLVHAFDGLTNRHGDMGDMKRRMPNFFLRQLDLAEARLELPAKVAEKKTLTLPTVAGAGDPAGVRVYLRFGENNLGHFQVPTVEAVALGKAEREALRFSDQPRTLSAAMLKSWLCQCYPPAVMDGMGGFRQISGTLTWKPAGQDANYRYAIISGIVSFELDNQGRAKYEGPLEMALRYRGDKRELADFRGVLSTIVPKQNPQGIPVEWIDMAVTIESLSGTPVLAGASR